MLTTNRSKGPDRRVLREYPSKTRIGLMTWACWLLAGLYLLYGSVISAESGADPLGSSKPIHAQYRNGTPNFIGALSFLPFNQVANCNYEIPRCPSFMGASISKNCFVVSEWESANVCRLSVVHRFVSDSEGLSIRGNPKTPDENNNSSSVSPYESNIQNIAPVCQFREFSRIESPRIVDQGNNFGLHRNEEVIRSFPEGSRTPTGCRSGVGKAESGSVANRNVVPASKRETTVVSGKSLDLAHKMFFLAVDHQTVRRNINLVVFPSENNDKAGSRQRSRTQQCHQDPKYVRRNDQGWVAFKEHTEHIGNHDIDVSYDGKKWLHLFGQYCTTDSPPFSLEVIRQCSKRGRSNPLPSRE
jgi:hypothetical protein